jgi:hypothetical protein
MRHTNLRERRCRGLQRRGVIIMTTLKTIAAAAALAVLTATPVFAQAAIQEPGLLAFYHPNLDVLNSGSLTPAARHDAREQWRFTHDSHRTPVDRSR